MESEGYSATNHCVLCRAPFPLRCLPGLDRWQSNFRAVLCLYEDEENVQITDPAWLPDFCHDDEIEVPVTGNPEGRSITIRNDLRDRGSRIAFCFHDWCYSTFVWELKSPPDLVSIIYRLARSLKKCQHNPGNRLQTLIAHAQRFMPRIPSFSMLSRLPTEIWSYIWEYVGSMTPCSAFILVAGEMSCLARLLRFPSSCDIRLQPGSYISARMITVFGTRYIRDLSIDEDRGVNYQTTDKNVTTVGYATDLGGICAIKLNGVDREWLGDISSAGNVWYGMIEQRYPDEAVASSRVVARLRWSYNDMFCNDIPGLGEYILWDQPDYPSSIVDLDTRLFDFERDINRPTVIETPDRRLFRYLSLYNKGEYISGVTCYLSAKGIIGLEAHFAQTTRLSGSRNGCALHFPLRKKERIIYAWLRIVYCPGLVAQPPALVVSTPQIPLATVNETQIQTTLGRTHTFGPYILPSLVIDDDAYRWVLLESDGCISGFYDENPRGDTILRLGVIGDGSPLTTAPLIPQYHMCDFPSPHIATPNAGLFLSVAILAGAERVDACHIGHRYAGILVYYPNGFSAVLGQWHTSHPSRHSCIYRSNESGLTSIRFTVSKLKDRQIVTGISFSTKTDKTSQASDSKVFNIEEPIAWWFSKSYDAILPWTGRLYNAPQWTTTDQQYLSHR